MAKLPNIKRLVVEDFPAAERKWLPQLLSPLNSFMEAVYAALNRQLTVNDNMAGEVRAVELDGVMPLELAWSLKTKPRAVIVGDCYRKDGTELTLVDAVGVRWHYTQGGALSVDQVVGVTPSASARYVLELVILTG